MPRNEHSTDRVQLLASGGTVPDSSPHVRGHKQETLNLTQRPARPPSSHALPTHTQARLILLTCHLSLNGSCIARSHARAEGCVVAGSVAACPAAGAEARHVNHSAGPRSVRQRHGFVLDGWIWCMRVTHRCGAACTCRRHAAQRRVATWHVACTWCTAIVQHGLGPAHPPCGGTQDRSRKGKGMIM